MFRKRRSHCILLVSLFVALTCYLGLLSNISLFWQKRLSYNSSFHEDREYLIYTEGCRIPKLDPFDASVACFYEEEHNPLHACHSGSYFLMDEDTLLLNQSKVHKDFGNVDNLDCVYYPILRNPNKTFVNPDHEVGYGQKKSLLFGKAISEEFIKVQCFRKDDRNTSLFEDYISFVRLKPEVEKRCEEAGNKRKSIPLSVIMIAIDSVSKLNFLRHFPKTHSFLQKEVQSFDFQGYVKVADNTFVNIVPMLTGRFVREYDGEESSFKNKFADDLPLVWKEFKALGYRTFFIEDSPNIGTFTYLKRGFKHQPTDYFLRPFAMAVEKSKWRTKKGFYCFGHTSEVEYFYGYLKRFISKMEDRPFFAFTFISRPTHDYLNRAGFADEPTRDLLKEFVESGVLNRSVLIFFSDHGIRFGDIRKTYIGKMEERMPFMFQLYPERFLKREPEIAKNLAINQRRLTTPFDIHETLQHVAMLSSRSNELYGYRMDHGKGLSLLREIPTNRTCADAHISDHWCTCHEHFKVSTSYRRVFQLARFMMKTINTLLNSSHFDSPCAKLSVKKVIDAYVSVPQMLVSQKLRTREYEYLERAKKRNAPNYLVTVQAFPSDAIFEGTLRYQSSRDIQLIGDISRINTFHNQSWCIEDHRFKKYCFCKKWSRGLKKTSSMRP